VWQELLRQQWPSIPPIALTTSSESFFYQLSRPPLLLRKYDHGDNGPFQQHQFPSLTPAKFCLDNFALTVHVKNNDDQLVFSRCLSVLDMEVLLETGLVKLIDTGSLLAISWSAFVHAWDLRTMTTKVLNKCLL
jgi:hypothetical protein